MPQVDVGLHRRSSMTPRRVRQPSRRWSTPGSTRENRSTSWTACGSAPAECYVVVGTFARRAPTTSDYTGSGIYHRSVRERREDWLTVHTRLSVALGHGLVLVFAGVRGAATRRPPAVAAPVAALDVYWKLMELDRRRSVSPDGAIGAGIASREDVVRDIEVRRRAAEFLGFLDVRDGNRAVWLCPLRQRDPSARWDLHVLDSGRLHVNIGFWSSVELATWGVRRRPQPGHRGEGGRTRRPQVALFDVVLLTGGVLADLRWCVVRQGETTYEPDVRLLSLYDKTVRRR